MGQTIGIVGLGRVGIQAARAYLNKGYEVYGYARRREVIQDFLALGGKHVNSPAEMAQAASTLIVLVLNDAQVIDVVTSETGLLAGCRPGHIIINMSTINRTNLECVAQQCAGRQVKFVDCPFTGGPARVPTGSLTLIAAAPGELIEEVRPVLEIIGKIVHVGNRPGLGQAVKHCNQLLVGSTHAAVMEVITLARRLDLDVKQVCGIIGSGIAGSDYFRLLSESVLDGKPSPGGLGQMCKDMSIVVNTGRDVKAPLYVATAAYYYFLGAQALNMENMEGADLIRIVDRISNPDTA
jgi:3-hydroxyisobutyrate dehydrogenase-like beta-hydroxyacid dehydrogenase